MNVARLAVGSIFLETFWVRSDSSVDFIPLSKRCRNLPAPVSCRDMIQGKIIKTSTEYSSCFSKVLYWASRSD